MAKFLSIICCNRFIDLEIMSTYFIADLHLSEHEPHITELFLQFMAEKAPLAEAVYILGDLFEIGRAHV